MRHRRTTIPDWLLDFALTLTLMALAFLAGVQWATR